MGLSVSQIKQVDLFTTFLITGAKLKHTNYLFECQQVNRCTNYRILPEPLTSIVQLTTH